MLYAKVTRAWSIVFLFVGISFLVDPGETGRILTQLANGLGFRGRISTPTGSLWWVLSLSLMSAVTLLAHFGARDPKSHQLYFTLLVAKIVSTAGFTLLAFRLSPAWIVCAFGDGFVALSLWLARHWRSKDTPSLLRRWFDLMGAGSEKNVQRRIANHDPLVRRLHPIFGWVIDWWGPTLLLRRPLRAIHLPENEFDLLFQKLKTHGSPLVRGVATLFEWPCTEVLHEDSKPDAVPHPLDHHQPPTPKEEYDTIVIGSGAGGAPVAWSLAKQGKRVAILERGGLVRPDTTVNTLRKHFVAQASLVSSRYSSIVVLAGEGLGGTTAINSGTSLRPLPECLQGWNANLSLEPWLDLAEEAIGVTVPPRDLLCASSGIFEKGLAGIGREGAYVLPRNAPDCEGRGRCCFGCPAGAKRSADKAFLPEAVSAGADLFPETSARRIVEKSDRVEVETSDGRVFRADNLVLSAGALHTPNLLRKNRLGSAWKRAGHHLKIHPACKVFAHFPELEHGDRGVPQAIGYRPPELPRITLEGVHTPKSSIGPMLLAGGSRFRWWFDRSDHLATFGLMIRDRSTGRVSQIGNRPTIDYTLHEEDARDLGEGLKLIAEAFFAAGADRVLLPVGGGNNDVSCREELEIDYAPSRLLVSGFHPQGTAGMGRVVNNDLKLTGSDRIHVCDASVLPDSPGVNPQVTIMALGLRLADHLAKRETPLPSRTEERGVLNCAN